MTDEAIHAIAHRPKKGLTFRWFRATFKADDGLKNDLGLGHAVLDSVPKLNQYLYTYGPMIASQWECVARYLDENDWPDRWIDYGCGQGLAGLLVNDLTRGDLPGDVGDVLLIEPSVPALARAEALYARIAPNAAIRTVPKRFDDIEPGDLPSAGCPHTVHIFSNILDVTGFDPLRLFNETVKSGRHTFISVSHDRRFDGGTPQIEEIKAVFESPTMARFLTIHRSELDWFRCDNPGRSEGVVWFCELEAHDG